MGVGAGSHRALERITVRTRLALPAVPIWRKRGGFPHHDVASATPDGASCATICGGTSRNLKVI